MSRPTITNLLTKYKNGKASDAEREVVEQWYALLEEDPRPLSDSEYQELENRLWVALQQKALGKNLPIKKQITKLWQGRLAVAAAVALVCIFSYLIYWQFKANDKGNDGISRKLDKGMKYIDNPTNEKRLVNLADGSRVLLLPKSELRYPEEFTGSERVVQMSGEAFFDISKDPDHPFIVNTGEISTKVLGTSFQVKAIIGDPNVEVAVKTGKVTVYEQARAIGASPARQGSGVVLTPNHQVSYLKGAKVFLTSLVGNPMPVMGQKSSFTFADTPLDQVLSQLGQAYNISIELEKQDLGHCPLTARLGNNGLYAQLDIICAAIQGSYEIKGTTILIDGKGCETPFKIP